MYYPLNLLKTENEIAPLFGNQLIGEPYIFDFSSGSKHITNYMVDDFDTFQKNVFFDLEQNNAKWGIGKYLENRKELLSQFPQFLAEGRYYHLGIDIVVPADFYLYAPIDGQVYKTGMDKGFRNYGGYIVLKHEINGVTFYSFYGHLKKDFFINEGDVIKQGEAFAQIGEREDSGEWFTHTHLQILTQKAIAENFITTGYISENKLKNIEEYFPSPYLLFRY